VLDRCGVLDDTPANRLELQKGIAQIIDFECRNSRVFLR